MEEKFYPVDLPSKLLPYQNLGVKEVSMRMLKGKDEKYIAELNVQNFEKKFMYLLKDSIKGIDPMELTIGDRMYILVWLSMNCYSKLYPIEFDCEQCLRKIETDVDLTVLDKVELPKEYKEPYAMKLPSGQVLNLKLLRVKDQIQYLDYIAQKQRDDILVKLALTVVDDQKNLLQRVEMLENLSTQDLGMIRAFHEKFYHGVKLETKYSCQHCGGAGLTPVPFRLDIIFPEGKTVAKSLNYNF